MVVSFKKIICRNFLSISDRTTSEQKRRKGKTNARERERDAAI